MNLEREVKINELKENFSSDSKSNKLFQFHPYLGYAGVPGAYPWGKEFASFNEFGILSLPNYKYPYQKKADEFVIAVLGGSMAEIFANLGAEYFNNIAAQKLGFTKKVIFINLATAGYKQPQQLIQLNLAILSGFEFDAVLNFDGFNDVALAQENQNMNGNALFPSLNHFALMAKLSDSPDKETIDELSHYYNLIDYEINVLNLLQKPFLQFSPSFALFGDAFSKYFDKKRSVIKYRLTKTAHNSLNSAFVGPLLNRNDIQFPVDIWQQSSRIIFSILKQKKITYVHALQPNQYYEGSKPLSEKEKEIAYNPNHPWGSIIKKHYSLMIKAGNELKKEGVPFYDLTGIFEENNEDLYVDDCCHVGDRGNEILAEKFVDIIFTEQSIQSSE